LIIPVFFVFDNQLFMILFHKTFHFPTNLLVPSSYAYSFYGMCCITDAIADRLPFNALL